MYIFLDDIRNPEDVTWVKLPKKVEWKVVRNYKEFVELLESLKDIPTHISFDHDLADHHYTGDYTGERTGHSCAKALIEIAIDKNWKHLPKITVHSMNPVGKKNIEETIKSGERFIGGGRIQ